MNLFVLKSDLVNVLSKVISVVGRGGQIPILSHVLLQGGDGALRVVGTDLEIELSASCDADISLEGEVTVPARKLFDIARALPEGKVKLQLTGTQVTLSIGNSRYKLSTLLAADYPLMVDKGTAKESKFGSPVIGDFRIQGAELKDLISKTSFAMGDGDARHYLNGLLLELSKNKVRAVATNGHRLAVCDFASEAPFTETIRLIIPRKTVAEIPRLFGDGGEIKLSFGSGYICVEGSGVTLVSVLVDGKYPDYERVFPKNLNSVITADRSEMISAFGRASILANEKYRGVKLTPSEGLLEIEASNPEAENATDQIDIAFSGDSFEIGFNVVYLIEALKSFGGTRIDIRVNDATSSVIISDPSAEAKHEVVVMPMRL
ncbi:DNA polymerase III subunit beta [Porticoccaceae bacterium]|nr:DNA polymerase III subunit beta [Porticoccaceae bacterium]